MSKIQNCTSRKFDGFSGRGEIADIKNTPGPGNYRLPSDFGHYISKKALKKVSGIDSKREESKGHDKENIVVTDL